MILVLDTHAEEVFIGLWDKKSLTWVHRETFLGGRQLNSLILNRLEATFLYSQEGEDVLYTRKTDLTGIIVAAGPGSFTGLRIGISVANTLAYAMNVPVVAPVETESTKQLLQEGLNMLKSAGSQFDAAVIPYYGSDPHITKPRS